MRGSAGASSPEPWPALTECIHRRSRSWSSLRTTRCARTWHISGAVPRRPGRAMYSTLGRTYWICCTPSTRHKGGSCGQTPSLTPALIVGRRCGNDRSPGPTSPTTLRSLTYRRPGCGPPSSLGSFG
eukprot:2346790-Amphidinium_carterae.1